VSTLLQNRNANSYSCETRSLDSVTPPPTPHSLTWTPPHSPQASRSARKKAKVVESPHAATHHPPDPTPPPPPAAAVAGFHDMLVFAGDPTLSLALPAAASIYFQVRPFRSPRQNNRIKTLSSRPLPSPGFFFVHLNNQLPLPSSSRYPSDFYLFVACFSTVVPLPPLPPTHKPSQW
jgi:hypothetical protein